MEPTSISKIMINSYRSDNLIPVTNDGAIPKTTIIVWKRTTCWSILEDFHGRGLICTRAALASNIIMMLVPKWNQNLACSQQAYTILQTPVVNTREQFRVIYEMKRSNPTPWMLIIKVFSSHHSLSLSSSITISCSSHRSISN